MIRPQRAFLLGFAAQADVLEALGPEALAKLKQMIVAGGHHIIALLAGYVGPRLFGQVGQAKAKAAQRLRELHALMCASQCARVSSLSLHVCGSILRLLSCARFSSNRVSKDADTFQGSGPPVFCPLHQVGIGT
jgi:hypothetical protein